MSTAAQSRSPASLPVSHDANPDPLLELARLRRDLTSAQVRNRSLLRALNERFGTVAHPDQLALQRFRLVDGSDTAAVLDSLPEPTDADLAAIERELADLTDEARS